VKIVVGGTQMIGRVDYERITPLDSNIGAIPSASVVVEDPTKSLSAITLPRIFHDTQIYEDDTVTLQFGGYVNTITELPLHPVGRAWSLACQGYGARLLETATGSLNKTGLLDSDRNFVINILEDALKSQTFGGNTIDDAIIAANVGWPGIAHTAFISGLDWSYMTPSNAIGNLQQYVPNVYLSVGKDRVVTYGLMRTLAPFALHSSPNGTTLRGFSDYVEEEDIYQHKNKMRRGGAAASEVTATDEMSWAKFGRILDDAYRNDSTIPASDLRRRTYAELRRHRTRRHVNFTVRDKGLEAGMLVDVVNTRVGPGTRPGVMFEVDELISRSVSGALAGERGRLLVTKVKTTPLGNMNYSYAVEAGDVVTDFALQLPAGTE